nr:hypothetical protein [Rubellimicrobium thermophilum]
MGQRGITRLVPVAVVDVLEAIGVDHQDRIERRLGPAGGVSQAGCRLLEEGTAVGQPGQGIGQRSLPQPFAQTVQPDRHMHKRTEDDRRQDEAHDSADRHGLPHPGPLEPDQPEEDARQPRCQQDDQQGQRECLDRDSLFHLQPIRICPIDPA